MQDWDIAGIGGYLKCPDGNIIWTFSEVVKEKKLNAKHELLALEAGILRCINDKITHLKCHSDLDSLSKNLNSDDLKQVLRRNPVFSRIVSLLDNFESITFNYIPRNKNHKADQLSKETILKKTKYKIKKVDDAFTCKNFVCAENYPKNKRFRFYKVHQPIDNYLVFHTKDNNILDTYRVVKAPDMVFEKIDSLVLRQKWEVHLLEIITAHLKNCSFDRVGLMIRPVGNCLDKKLRGTKSIEPDELAVFEEFKASIARFKKVVLNYHEGIYSRLFMPESKIVSEQKIIENMKMLGECDDPYTATLQKKEFGEFINLMLHQSDIQKDMPELIKKARLKLISSGVNLKC